MTIDGRRVGHGSSLQAFETRGIMLYAAALVVLAFLISNPIYLAALCLSTWLVIAMGGLARKCRLYATAGLFAAAGVAVINPLVSRQGATVLWDGPILPVVGHFTVTAEAVAFGMGMGLRLFLVASAFAVYAAVVDPDAALRILGRVSFGSALVAALGIRLFPTMAADAARIMDAQRTRGLRLDEGSRRERLAARKPVVDCLLLTSLERAVQVAESMESRGYGNGKRTRVAAERRQPRDWWFFAATVSALCLGACATMAGPGRFTYYPELASPISPADAALLPALVILLIFPALMGWGWNRSHWLKSRI